MPHPHAEEATFKLENASFEVPGRTLLQPLSLTFPPGKMTALIGHNGSGKSTLLKMLGRHHAASSGEVLLNQQPVGRWNSKAFAREVAYLPQQLPAAEGMTVRELVAIGRYPWHGALGRFGQEDRDRVEDAITQVGLKPFAGRLVDSLSGGERQRAWLAMMVAQNSRCLLLDEPTSALDPELVGEVLSTIRALAEEKRTMVIVTHEMSFARDVADRAIFMDQGRIVEQGEAKALFSNPQQPRTRQFLDKFLSQ